LSEEQIEKYIVGEINVANSFHDDFINIITK